VNTAASPGAARQEARTDRQLQHTELGIMEDTELGVVEDTEEDEIERVSYIPARQQVRQVMEEEQDNFELEAIYADSYCHADGLDTNAASTIQFGLDLLRNHVQGPYAAYEPQQEPNMRAEQAPAAGTVPWHPKRTSINQKVEHHRLASHSPYMGRRPMSAMQSRQPGLGAEQPFNPHQVPPLCWVHSMDRPGSADSSLNTHAQEVAKKKPRSKARGQSACGMRSDLKKQQEAIRSQEQRSFLARRRMLPTREPPGVFDQFRNEMRHLFQSRENAPELINLVVAAYILMLPCTAAAESYSWSALLSHLPRVGGPTGFIRACHQLTPEAIRPRLAHKVAQYMIMHQVMPQSYISHSTAAVNPIKFPIPFCKWLWTLIRESFTGDWLAMRDKEWIIKHCDKALNLAATYSN